MGIAGHMRIEDKDGAYAWESINAKFDGSMINPLTSPGEGVTVFTSPYLTAGAPALGEAKGLILI